jgi:hypothetical protein
MHAYFLSLTAKVAVPIVVVGSQRPASALSTDAGINLANAIRTAAAPASRGLGVLVLLNDEIHAAREVTKTSTFRLQTFRLPDFGGSAPTVMISSSQADPRAAPENSSTSAPWTPCRGSTSSMPIRAGPPRAPSAGARFGSAGLRRPGDDDVSRPRWRKGGGRAVGQLGTQLPRQAPARDGF